MPFKLRESSDNYYELVVSQPLDREKVPEYDITFTVTDRGSPPLSDNETMTLELLDVNDNVPQFPQSFYTIRVMENNAPGALLSSLTAFDPDLHENQYLVYFILEREIANTSMSMLFSINPENGNLYALKTFDYEIESEFLFHIEARDSGSPPLSSNVTVHIIIVDQNDNAPVIVSPWRAHGSVVEEKIPRSTDKGSLVAKVIALDTDSVHNSRITYQFLQVTDATLFSLDQYNGEIRTMRMFSYRDPRHQRLVVVAKDNGQPTLSATVTIKLSTVETAVKAYSDMTEVPLEYDIFSDLNLYLVIGLGSVSFLLLITILVTIVLKCQKPKPSKAAPPCRNSVLSERNSTIADSTLVSNDAYWYSLFLAETRKGKMVVRQPVPKGSRYFVSSIPRGTGLTYTSDSAASTLQSPVKENIELDTVIAVVSVSDKDSGVNGVVDLHIPDNMPFKLRESSDNYYELVVSQPLDREKVPEYDITFTVTDRGSPPLSDNETMTLELLDVNDNVPQFPQSFYMIRVMENNAPGALLSSLTAFDPDLHENQYLVYFILEREIANTSMSMLFSINPENGNLYALKTFDYEIESEFLFHIEARDSGSPPLSSNVTVHIIIVDQNDNAPVIVSPWRAHGSVVEEKIPRSTDKGSLVAKVIALDTDSVHNSRITYQFLQVTDATLFSLDQYNGEIRTMRMFSYRDPRHQRLVVVAKDNGQPTLSATVTIKLSTVETAVKAYSDMTEVPLEYDIFSDLNLYLVIGLGSVSFLLLITILVTIVLKCQKPKPSKAAPPCRNSVLSERNSTIADSTLVSNDAYWYSLFLAETRKGKMVVRQPVPKGSRYFVSSIPRGTGLTYTSDSAASTLQVWT
ncbi:protocadherin gamma-A4-like [Pseudoliparis swirei]|uniref:protocadherin gamma-A4-like n=1 Tax=Pseudoliparis swirei TaxID=2059687 RepID=UPI0024BED15B|nr:protocadherin gamma-A4-like [Pseudoliparis swirei]